MDRTGFAAASISRGTKRICEIFQNTAYNFTVVDGCAHFSIKVPTKFICSITSIYLFTLIINSVEKFYNISKWFRIVRTEFKRSKLENGSLFITFLKKSVYTVFFGAWLWWMVTDCSTYARGPAYVCENAADKTEVVVTDVQSCWGKFEQQISNLKEVNPRQLDNQSISWEKHCNTNLLKITFAWSGSTPSKCCGGTSRTIATVLSGI